MQSYGLGAAVGLVGAAGSVSIWQIGVPYSLSNQSYSDNGQSANSVNDGDLSSTTGNADGQAGGASSLIGGLTSPMNNGAAGNTQFISGNVNSAQNGVNGSVTMGEAYKALYAIPPTTVPTGTVAFIGSGVSVTAGGNVNVRAKSEVSYTATVGGLAAGAVGIGGAIAVATIKGNTQAYIDTNSTVSAVGNIAVDAELVSDNASGTAFAGLAGLTTLGAQVVILNDSSAETATINAGVTIPQAQQVLVTAVSNRTLNAQAIGGSISGLGVGAGIAIANAGGGATASLGGSSGGGAIGQAPVQSVGSVAVTTTANDSATANVFAITAGVFLAGTVNIAETQVDPTVQASLGEGNITVTGGVTVSSQLDATLNATAQGISLSEGVGAAASLANATLTPTVETTATGTNVTAGAGGITLQTLYNATPTGQVAGPGLGASATAQAAAGGLIAGSGALPTATDGAVVSTTASGGTLAATGTGGVTLVSASFADPTATAGGIAGGLAGVGYTSANATEQGSTQANIDDNITGASSLTVTTLGTEDATANAAALSGGLIAGTLNSATATVQDAAPTEPAAQASISSGAIVTVTGNIALSSTSTDTASANVSGINGGAVALGASSATATVTATTQSSIGGGAALDAVGGNLGDLAQGTETATAGATSSTGGVAAISGTNASSTTQSTVQATVGNNATLAAGGNVTISANNTTSGVQATNNNNTGGAIADGSPTSTTTITNSSQATLGSNDVVTATGVASSVASPTGNISILATSQDSNDTSSSTAQGGGFVSLGNATATTTLTDPATATVGMGDTVNAFGTLLVQSQTGTSNVTSTTSTTGGGVGVNSTSTSTTTVTSSAATNVDPNAQLTADTVSLQAGATPSGRSDGATASASALGVSTTATANLTSTYSANVSVAGPATITGLDQVAIAANDGPIAPSAQTHGDSYALGGDTTSDANNTLTATTAVTVGSATPVTITAGNLSVSASSPAPNLQTGAERTAAAIDTSGSNANQPAPTQSDTILFNANVTILGAGPRLHIGPTGQVLQQSGGITFQNTGTRIVVNPITNTTTGLASISTGGAGQQISGNAHFHFGPAIAAVQITNDSPEALVIGSIQILNPNPTPNLQVSSSNAQNFTTTTDISAAAATQITITNTSGSNIILGDA